MTIPSIVTTQPPDTIRAPTHEDEDTIDGVVHAGGLSHADGGGNGDDTCPGEVIATTDDDVRRS